MNNKLQIIETPDYILAVSDKEIKEGEYYVTDTKEIFKCDFDSIGLANYAYDKIIAYQPKGTAYELDLPLLPEIDVEDDVEKLAIEFANLNKSKFNNWYGCHDGFIAGYKAATKVYSEEDLIRAIAMAKMAKTHDGLIDMDAWISNGYEGATPAYTEDEIIQSLKQPKMPLWFVAEFKGPKMIYSEKYETMIHNPECYKLKTTTINGKTYLVGIYE